MNPSQISRWVSSFGDGGTLVSSIRVTAPVLVAGKKGRIVFIVFSLETLALTDRSRFTHSCTSCCGYEREDVQDWNRCRQFDRGPSWTLGVAVESARLAQGRKLDRGYPRARRKGQDHRTERLLQSIATVLIDQLTLLSLD